VRQTPSKRVEMQKNIKIFCRLA